MPCSRVTRWFLVFFLCVLFFPADSVFAETVELVTYYPSEASTDNLHVNTLTVGAGYAGVTPLPDGTALFTGPVGIGPGFNTTAPNNLLQIASGAAGDGISLTGVSPGLSLFDGTNLRGGLGVASAAGQYGAETLPGDLSLFSEVGNLRFGTTAAAGNPSVRMTITPGGNVGIGTAAPGAPLEVSSGSTAVTNFLLSNTSVGGTRWNFQSVGSGVAGRTGNLEILPLGSTTGVTVTPAGNVGIGNGPVNPTVRLDVAQGGAIRIGNAYLSSGLPQYSILSSNGWFDGAWHIPDATRKSGCLAFDNSVISFYQTQTAGGTDWAQRLIIDENGIVLPQRPFVQYMQTNIDIKAAIGNDTRKTVVNRDPGNGNVYLYYWDGSQHRRIRLQIVVDETY